MKRVNKIFASIDWLLFILYTSLVLLGWCNLYAIGQGELTQSFFDFYSKASRQLIWIAITTVIFFLVFLFDSSIYHSLAYIFYAFTILLLLGTLIWGVSVGGHRAWLHQGGAGQPAELAKLACALAIAKYLDEGNTQTTDLKSQLILLGIILLPVGIILLQGDVGSSLVFASFFIIFYRERLFSWFLLVGVFMITIFFLTLLVPHLLLLISTVSLALILTGLFVKTWKRGMIIVMATLGILLLIEGTHFFFDQILKPHQQNRIKALINPNIDPLGIGWNTIQSKIAIGAGGLWGKGFCQSTQIKYGFVPMQSTDFVFCTIGEEHGWMGAFLVIGIFLGLLSRVLCIAERQRLRFARVYGYAAASILFFHFMINIGMTIGLMPVIGIPLPFLSYGGSSLWSFSLMLFILLKLDAERKNHLTF